MTKHGAKGKGSTVRGQKVAQRKAVEMPRKEDDSSFVSSSPSSSDFSSEGAPGPMASGFVGFSKGISEPGRKKLFDDSDEEKDHSDSGLQQEEVGEESRSEESTFTDEKIDIGLKATRPAIQAMQKAQEENMKELRHAEIYDPRVDEVTNIEGIRGRVLRVVGVLADFKSRRHPDLSRMFYLELLRKDISAAYGYSDGVIDILLGLFGPIDFHAFITACEKPRPLTIRVNSLKVKRRQLAQMLIARGVNLDPLGDWCKDGLQIFSSQVPIGATPEYLRGYYMIQDAASFLPPMALNPKPGERILDMSAAPGGKTTHLGALMQDSGMILANDMNRDRIPALQANLARMGVTCAVISCSDARELTQCTGNFDRVLLDAPCTGLGVVSKDASIKANRTFDDMHRLSHLQKELLNHAFDLLSKHPSSPRLVCYSTCSVTLSENEAVIDYILHKRNVEVVDLPFSFGKPGITRFNGMSYHPAIRKARRFYPHIHNTHGFFICLLRLKV
ncbi:Nucleolar protein NOP2 [Giardia lamblia P15]|uniref:Nucleolar protein NOP2 n=1 Tax=Giardia intestinalis (strain P15) TaxID=658858 RepID=E1F5H2_GIAIA|nr:Nucleolar protein NOP2 [Giardia lamblia P15]